MSRFNVLMQTHFRGCMCIGVGFDSHRSRHVQLYALPDNEVHVGVYDGIDCWIASAATNPFGLDADKRLREIAQGAVFEIEQGQTDMRYADGTYQKEGGPYNEAGGQPRPGLAKGRRRMGGAIPALPMPVAPISSPLSGPPKTAPDSTPPMNMPRRVSTGQPIAPPAPARRRITAPMDAVGNPPPGHVARTDPETGEIKPVKERRRATF